MDASKRNAQGDDRVERNGSMSSQGSTAYVSSEVSEVPVDGEYLLLLDSAYEEPSPLSQNVEAVLKRDLSKKNVLPIRELTEAAGYGIPLSSDDAPKVVPEGDGGLSWHATIVPDNFYIDGKLKKGLERRDFDDVSKTIKTRRPSLPVTFSDFMSSLTKVEGETPTGARYIFHGVLNGWPGLRSFELLCLEQKRKKTDLPTPKELISGQLVWMKTWSQKDQGKKDNDLDSLDRSCIYRASIRGSPWSGSGWSATSPGFCFWYESHRELGPRVSYGTNMATELSDATCTQVHMLSHRYAVARETPKDRITYHSICLLEWDHGKYGTICEAAYLNGMGGYKGKSNWYDDKDESVTSLYTVLPAEMICPWNSNQAEIRCYDVPMRNIGELKDYVTKYQGPTKRFVDPNFTYSFPARLSFRSKRQISQYLVNYILRDSSYGELKRNCQTFAADLCSFLAGKKKIEPFHPINRIEYDNKNHYFLYDSSMYEKKQNKKK